MTIFGFNTDIKFGDTVYHVQSEERRNDSLLQTQVFVRGRCIGKRSSSYAYIKTGGVFDESQMHELLKEQHRAMVEAARAGQVEQLLSQATDRALGDLAAKPLEAAESCPGDAAVDDSPRSTELELHFLNPDSVFNQRAVTFHFVVAKAGAAVPGAKVVARFQPATADGNEEAPAYWRAVTGSDGQATFTMETVESALPEASLLVQASHEGRNVTRKFRLKGK